MNTLSLGDRMKEFYENVWRIELPRRSNTIIRVDGKSFSTYTSNLKVPFDDDFMKDMDITAAYLCKHIMGAQFAFVQSDEISIYINDYRTLNTQAWFKNNLQKMASVSASMATRAFNEARLVTLGVKAMKWAEFDSRVFQIPSIEEVYNYFIWRQQDTTTNSISSVAQSKFSHNQLRNVNTKQMQEMLMTIYGINWNDFAPKYKRGRVVRKVYNTVQGALRSKWVSTEPPIFTQEKSYLKELCDISLG